MIPFICFVHHNCINLCADIVPFEPIKLPGFSFDSDPFRLYSFHSLLNGLLSLIHTDCSKWTFSETDSSLPWSLFLNQAYEKNHLNTCLK